ncbi:MAG: hypothetical protein K8L97_18325 [Anaerolineae bacterium]|nr:hypothetical protein [Anaerolineae bacterium]
MPVQVEWLEQPWILAVDYGGDVTADDVRKAIATSLKHLKEHPVHFLIDMSQSVSVDPDVLELSSLSEWIYHPNGRWFAYVQPGGAFKTFIKLRHRNPVRLFDDRNTALTFLQKAVELGIQT